MELINKGNIIYSGRVLSISEISPYKDSMPDLEVVYSHNEIVDCRRIAYKTESDSLYMEWQYDQSAESEQAWRDKVAEIKLRYPLPTES